MADVGPDELASTHLRVQLMGQCQVSRGPGTTPLRLPAGKATSVAQLLVVRRGSFVSVDTIVEALRGDEPPPEAAQNVASLVSRLRRVLGSDVISGGRTGYRFETSRIVVDVDVAERLVVEAEAQLRSGRPALAASAAAQARAILERGGFLEDEPYAPWAQEGRREAERLVRQARRAAWSAALSLDDNGVALEAATSALETNPLDEEAHRARMEALYRSGDAAGALAAYERLRTTLVDELGADPSPQSEALYLTILRSEPLPRPDVGEHMHRSASQPGGDGVVGREEELSAMTERWTAAAGGRPGVLVVAGTAGSGKTSICREVARQARSAGAAVLWSTCHEAERSLFLQPLLDALRAHLGAIPPGRVRALAGEWAGTLGELMPDLRSILAIEHYERATAEIQHRRSLEAVAGVFRNIALEQPLFVVLDDIHQAGESTLDTVHFILERLMTEPVLFVASTASEASQHVLKVLGRDASLVSMGPLSVATVERLARRFGGSRRGRFRSSRPNRWQRPVRRRGPAQRGGGDDDRASGVPPGRRVGTGPAVRPRR